MNILIGLLCLFTATARAADPCPQLLGNANPELPRFGGLRPRTPIQEMANLLLAYVPQADDVQIGIPVFLESTLRQGEQFGDGQRNALASYGPLAQAPFVAVLTRGPAADLALILSESLPGREHVQELEISVAGVPQTRALDAHGIVHLPVDLQSLNWDKAFDAQSVYFRPRGWSDWFAVQFPYAYVATEILTAGMDRARELDPLRLRSSSDVPTDLRRSPDAERAGFVLARTERSQRVHGAYLLPDNSKVLTSTGGVWTRYRLGLPFKNIYLVKDPRVLDVEEEEGVVSGTGPHYIGATGEIIVNSLGQDNLITLYGIPTVAPVNGTLAWGFTHQWVGAWLRPGQSFVTPQGLYHWHLNPVVRPVAAQVFTPPQVPQENNHFGFSAKP